jgi:hypothetical protein
VTAPMKTKAVIRYVSGREESFEVDLIGLEGPSADARMKEFVKNPTLMLQTEKELIIIPSTAIECITMTLPDLAGKAITAPNVRKAKRVK